MPHNLPYYALNSALLCPILCPTMSHTSYFALLLPNNQHAPPAGRATHDVATAAVLRFFPGFGNLDQMLVLHNRTLPRVSYLLNGWLVTLSVILLSVVQNKLSIYDSQ